MENQTYGKLFEALAKAQAVMEDAKKDSANPFFKSRYADLSSVWAACRKPLTDNGLSVLQTVDQIGDKLCLTTILGHSSGEYIKSVYPIQPTKPDAQAMGSAITYARRYALAAIVGICQSDDDGEAAVKEVREATPTKLNDEQVETILTHAGDDKERVNKILDFYNAKSLKEIPSSNYNKILSHLTKPKSQAKRVTA